MEKIKKKKSWIREWTEGIIVAFIIAMIIRTFIVQAFRIPTGSMQPTLKVGDRILVNKFIYKFREPKRGEIIVFVYPENPKKDYIKRLIALGGEKALLKDGEIYINGERLQAPASITSRYYWSSGYYGVEEAENGSGEILVPEGRFYVLGDNSANSKDSRYWGFVPKKNLIGRAFFIYWPLTRLGRPIY